MVAIHDCLRELPSFAQYATLVHEARRNNNALRIPITERVHKAVVVFVHTVQRLPLANPDTKIEAHKLLAIVDYLFTNSQNGAASQPEGSASEMSPRRIDRTTSNSAIGQAIVIDRRLEELEKNLVKRFNVMEHEMRCNSIRRANVIALQLGMPMRTIKRHDAPLPPGIPATFPHIGAMHKLSELQLKTYIIYLIGALPGGSDDSLSVSNVPESAQHPDLVKAMRGLLGVPSQSAVHNQLALLNQKLRHNVAG